MRSNIVQLCSGKARTFPKAPAEGFPLGHGSGHHVRIHRAWPRMRLRDLARLCSHSCDIPRVHTGFIETFSKAAFPKHIIDDLEIFAQKVRQAHSREPRTCSENAPGLGKPEDCVRLVLPFHPALYETGFAKKIRTFCSSQPWLSLLVDADMLRLRNSGISWTNPGRHLHISLRG